MVGRSEGECRVGLCDGQRLRQLQQIAVWLGKILARSR